MDLNGALSNPFERHKLLLGRLPSLHHRLLALAAQSPRKPQPRLPRAIPLHEMITELLEQAGQPIPVSELREAIEQRLGRRLPRTTLKAALAAGLSGDRPRFRRQRYGVYEIAE